MTRQGLEEFGGGLTRRVELTKQAASAPKPEVRVTLQRVRARNSVRELLRTNDVVLVSAVGALLDGARIDHLVLDQNMSIIEGSLGIIPRRILVHEDDNRAARQVLIDAGLAHELRADE